MEASLLPVNSDVSRTAVADYREELILTLSTVRQTALETIRKAQEKYKARYDRHTDDIIATGLEIRYSSGLQAMSQEDSRNCLDHGMGHIESKPATTRTSLPRKSTLHWKMLYTFIRIA